MLTVLFLLLFCGLLAVLLVVYGQRLHVAAFSIVVHYSSNIITKVLTLPFPNYSYLEPKLIKLKSHHFCLICLSHQKGNVLFKEIVYAGIILIFKYVLHNRSDPDRPGDAVRGLPNIPILDAVS